MTVTLAEHWLHAEEYESALDECLPPRARPDLYRAWGIADSVASARAF